MIGRQSSTMGVFEGTEVLTIIEGFGAIPYHLEKLVIINKDTVAITPVIQVHNLDRVGDEDEYIDIIPQTEIAVNNRMVFESTIYLGANQNLEISLSAEPTTTQPQYMMVLMNHV
jgi:hypothetical protein|tara:strand:+ start:273 stop:617 length:345 start_codon:yes stop_codon:yes gene_type:complete